jgi:TetR/AcrR family transcriptional regulator, biofilm operon repressor
MNPEALQELIDEAPSTKEKLFRCGAWLFATKGYQNVGIRELCRSIGLKESAFYNHYAGKGELLDGLFEFYRLTNEETALDDREIEEAIATGRVEDFFASIMRKFSALTARPMFHVVRRLVVMESFTNPRAAGLARRNLYQVRRGSTERALRELMARGKIRDCDVERVTAEYYYGLIGLLDEYILVEAWEGAAKECFERIGAHIAFFSRYLEKEDGGET